MVEPVTWHPAADRATSEALIVEQDRTVVPLSTWVADAAVQAGATERVLQVLTPARSRITYPLEPLLRDAGARWVVREGTERFRDGLTGFRLRWNTQRFATDLDAPPPAPPEAQPGSGDLEVQISTLHPALESGQLGASTETVLRTLTGSPPASWGVGEAVTQPWSPRELTAHCRERAQAPTRLVVVGPGVVEALATQLAGTVRSVIVAAQQLPGTAGIALRDPAGLAHRRRARSGACPRRRTGWPRPAPLLDQPVLLGDPARGVHPALAAQNRSQHRAQLRGDRIGGAVKASKAARPAPLKLPASSTVTASRSAPAA